MCAQSITVSLQYLHVSNRFAAQVNVCLACGPMAAAVFPLSAFLLTAELLNIGIDFYLFGHLFPTLAKNILAKLNNEKSWAHFPSAPAKKKHEGQLGEYLLPTLDGQGKCVRFASQVANC